MKKTSAYCMKNGILHVDGKATFGIGSHYYPSYHPCKVPTPENGDRIGEMQKDFADMKAAHVNVVRTAAIGDFSSENGEVRASFPLGTSIAEELEKSGIALVVRLNGYDNGINDYPDEKMLDESGNPLEKTWSQFITNSVCHKGAKADNEKVTAMGAEYFGKFDNVVGFQIYNEPALPCNGFYDYNPAMLKAYREYSAENGKPYFDPPRRRPYYNEAKEPWIDWRLFNLKKFNDYLNDLADIAKSRKPAAETFTCMTCCPVQTGSTMRGADYFRVAKKMDMLGITLYLDCNGAFYYEHSRVLDYAESAAAAFNKHFWLIEYNAKTSLSAHDFEVETYAAIGSGVKGIMYYQWRGDYNFDNSPEPDGFGMVYNDRKPTPKYERAMLMHELLYRLSDKIVSKERVRQGIGMLHSEHANAWYDAVCNGDNRWAWSGKESVIFHSMTVYRMFKREFVSPVAVRCEELENLPFSLDVLIIPAEKGLSESETKEIERFIKNGGKVFWFDEYLDSFKPYVFCDRWYTANEIVETYAKKIASVKEEKIDLKFLEDENEYLISVIDFSEEERTVHNLGIELFIKTAADSCTMISGDKTAVLPVVNNGDNKKIIIPQLDCGCIILIDKR